MVTGLKDRHMHVSNLYISFCSGPLWYGTNGIGGTLPLTVNYEGRYIGVGVRGRKYRMYCIVCMVLYCSLHLHWRRSDDDDQVAWDSGMIRNHVCTVQYSYVVHRLVVVG